MEIILALVAIVLAGYWFWYRNQSDKPAASGSLDPEAPYKVETPAPQTVAAEPRRCGCGRSQSGFCVGLHALTPEQWAQHADNPYRTKPAEAVAKTAAKKPAAKRPAKAKEPKAKAPTAKPAVKPAATKAAKKPATPKQ